MATQWVAKKSVTINTTKARVWDAITNPDLIKKYFFGTEAVSDFKKGSAIYYRGVWEGKPYEDKGTILEVEKEKLLKHDYWSSFSGIPDVPENYNTITYELSGKDGAVTLTVTQDNVRSEEVRDHSMENWGMVFDSMKDMLENE